MTYGAPLTGAPRPGSHAWVLDEATSHTFMKQALELGINFFDTANVYSSGASEMLPLCRSEGIGVIPWSPLARGRLTRPWQSETTRRFETDQYGKSLYGLTEAADRKVVDRLEAVSRQRGVPMAQVALAWLFGKPGLTAPIVGATKPQHLTDALAALDLRLSPEDVAALEEPYRPHATVGHL